MNDNGHKEQIQDLLQVSCMFCGVSANLESKDVIVETHGNLFSHGEILQVWHRRCFEDYLDEGEET